VKVVVVVVIVVMMVTMAKGHEMKGKGDEGMNGEDYDEV